MKCPFCRLFHHIAEKLDGEGEDFIFPQGDPHHHVAEVQI